MGLSAVVFRPGFDDLGEPESVLAQDSIGSVTMVGHLRERASQCIGKDSLVVSRVLYSGTHSGDEIPHTEMASLLLEIRTLEQDDDNDVRRFCSIMSELTEAALAHDASITFI